LNIVRRSGGISEIFISSLRSNPAKAMRVSAEAAAVEAARGINTINAINSQI